LETDTTLQDNKEKSSESTEIEKQNSEANTCIGIGAAVGVIGATAAVVTGAVCPICIVATPGLIGLGVYRRWKNRSCSGS
jgi:hypothetical protein